MSKKKTTEGVYSKTQTKFGKLVPITEREIEVLKALERVEWKPHLEQVSELIGKPMSSTWDSWSKLRKRSDFKVAVTITLGDEE